MLQDLAIQFNHSAGVGLFVLVDLRLRGRPRLHILLHLLQNAAVLLDFQLRDSEHVLADTLVRTQFRLNLLLGEALYLFRVFALCR